MLLQGQLTILAQLPGHVQSGFWVLWGPALGHELRIPTNLWVTLRVGPTRWVSLTCDFGLSLQVEVVDGLHKFAEVPQGDRPVMVHHLISDAMGHTCVSLAEVGEVVPLYVGHQAVELHKIHHRAGSFGHD